MGTTLEPYEILSALGRKCVVRKVRRKKDGLLVVCREISVSSMNEIERQSLLYKSHYLHHLHHPNIVRVYDNTMDESSGMIINIVEYCSGGNLASLITKCHKSGCYLEERFIWRIIKELCDALKACHEKHFLGEVVLHRNIKPSNVLLDNKGNIKLDFCLELLLSSDSISKMAEVGIPHYLSPEFINNNKYNEKSDIWSVGCLIYELCALKPPFQSASQNELVTKINLARYDRIPEHYSVDMRKIIDLMLTHEDYLRPTALMILCHSSLVRNTRESECLQDAVPLSTAAFLQTSAESLTSYESSERSLSSISSGTVRMKPQEEGKLAKAVKNLDLDTKSGSCCSVDAKCSGRVISQCELRLRLKVLWSLEAQILEKRKNMQEREQELAKRERRIHKMEKEVKLHLLRARIYMRRARWKVGYRKKYKPSSSGSGDVGYDEYPTVALINTGSLLNPFLKMREKTKKVIFSNPVYNCKIKTTVGNANAIKGITKAATDIKKLAKSSSNIQGNCIEGTTNANQVNTNDMKGRAKNNDKKGKRKDKNVKTNAFSNLQKVGKILSCNWNSDEIPDKTASEIGLETCDIKRRHSFCAIESLRSAPDKRQRSVDHNVGLRSERSQQSEDHLRHCHKSVQTMNQGCADQSRADIRSNAEQEVSPNCRKKSLRRAAMNQGSIDPIESLKTPLSQGSSDLPVSQRPVDQSTVIQISQRSTDEKLGFRTLPMMRHKFADGDEGLMTVRPLRQGTNKTLGSLRSVPLSGCFQTAASHGEIGQSRNYTLPRTPLVPMCCNTEIKKPLKSVYQSITRKSLASTKEVRNKKENLTVIQRKGCKCIVHGKTVR